MVVQVLQCRNTWHSENYQSWMTTMTLKLLIRNELSPFSCFQAYQSNRPPFRCNQPRENIAGASTPACHFCSSKCLAWLSAKVTHTQSKEEGGLKSSIVQHLPGEEIKWWLTHPSDGSDELEEVVLWIQGVLCKRDLPPLRTGHRWESVQKKRDKTDLPTSEVWRTVPDSWLNLSHFLDFISTFFPKPFKVYWQWIPSSPIISKGRRECPGRRKPTSVTMP